MRIKKDFVTNSSSTSFIVIDKKTGEVLKEMIEVVRQEGNLSRFKNAKKILENPDFDQNVNFPFTINEGTYIYRLCPAKVRVDTSFNHDWRILPFETKSCTEFDDDWEKSHTMPFIDLKDMKLKSRRQIANERAEEDEKEHQEWLRKQEELKREDKKRLRNK